MKTWRCCCDSLKEIPEGRRSLAIIGIAGPLIALIGTLCGMMREFPPIAIKGTGVTPAELIDDIRSCLGMTLLGVSIVIPIILVACRARDRTELS